MCCTGFSYCSGLTTSGLHGCPMCHDNIDSRYEEGLGKVLYGRHRRHLPIGHSMRYDRDHWFSSIEEDGPPIWPNGDDWLNRWAKVENGDIVKTQSGMRRLSIWYQQLPYWKVFKHTCMETNISLSSMPIFTII